MGDISEEQAEDIIRGMSEQKFNVHKFLNDVRESEDTTKTGYLMDEELGVPKLPVRTFQELAVFCEDVAGMDYFSKYFRKVSETITATSLSRNAKLIDLAVLQRKELADVTPVKKKENSGWFGKKDKDQPQLTTA